MRIVKLRKNQIKEVHSKINGVTACWDFENNTLTQFNSHDIGRRVNLKNVSPELPICMQTTYRLK
jgi:hypothetical protein